MRAWSQQLLAGSVTSHCPRARRPIGIGLDYGSGSGANTKWLFFCSKDSDCPSGYACTGAKGLKSAGGVCGTIRWSVGAHANRTSPSLERCTDPGPCAHCPPAAPPAKR